MFKTPPRQKQDLQSSPVKTTGSAPFLTPQTFRHNSPDKQCWTVSFKCREGSDSIRPVVFSKQRLAFNEPKPLIPGLVEKLNSDRSKLRALIKKYSQKLSKDERTKLDASKSRLNYNVAKLSVQVIFVLNPWQIVDEFPNNDETGFIVKCLNANTSFIKRFKIVARISSVMDMNDDQLTVWSGLKDYDQIMLQLDFEQQLSDFNINFTPLNKLTVEPTIRTRIVFTDVQQSSAGLNYLMSWIQNYTDIDDDIEVKKNKLKFAGPKQIIEDLNALDITYVDFEMAWGHIMNDGRHMHEKIVFATSMQALHSALDLSSPNSTFVFDSHGGASELTAGKQKLKGSDLKKHIKSIIDMIGPNITHVVLSVCATGCLASTINSRALLNKDKYTSSDFAAAPHLVLKNRKKLFVAQNTACISTLFEKLSFENMESFASYFATLLLTRKRQDSTRGTAFTFSPSLLFPDNVYGGVIGVPASISERRDWPDYHQAWEADERFKDGKDLAQFAYKSVTLYNSEYNRKALDGAKWNKSRSSIS